MTKIADLLAAGPTTSFEFFPGKTEEQAQRLEKVLQRLEPIGPSFVSVTYGALGSSRAQTRAIVEHIHADTSMTVLPHLTCVAQRRDEIEELVVGYRDIGVQNLLALGGDPPADGLDHPSDFTYAVELIELARSIGDFSIGVAAIPEGHPRSPDLVSDRRHLAEKLTLADFGITNFFFVADDYLRLLDDLAALGVEKPVLPGLMLFTTVDSVRRMAAVNRTTIPDELEARLDAADGDPAAVRKVAVDVAVDLAGTLLDRGAPGLHLITMNFSQAALEVCAQLGLAPA
ncbi:MAG: methylenetetrahydrofolate reductase [Acidimicrobiia bacterium]